MVGKEETIEV